MKTSHRYAQSHWRAAAAPIITKVLEETKGKSESEIRQALQDAYPFGPRQHHPYRIWLNEIAFQRNTGTKVSTYEPGEKIVFPDAPIGK